MQKPWRPTKEQLAAAKDKKVPDIIAPNLKVLFCGINPGLYSAAVRHNFGRPGNRFWPTLQATGITPRLLNPFEEKDLLKLGFGITNLVELATSTADELKPQELVNGRRKLEDKVRKYQPRIVAFLGLTAYRTAYARKEAKVGRQKETIDDTVIWVLPNPSGLNANYQLPDLVREFQKVVEAI